MSNKKFSGELVTRRGFMQAAAIGSGAMLGIGLTASPAAASSKMPQKAVKYQPTPKGSARCDNCTLWQPPHSCKLVDGIIAPSGWCVLYKPKAKS